MKIENIMTHEVVTVAPSATVIEVEELLHSKNVSGVPVVNEYNVVVGLVTEQDLFSQDHSVHLPTYAWLLKGSNFVLGAKEELPYEADRVTRITAEEVMNRQVFFAAPDMDIEKVASKAATLDQNPIPVTDYANKLLGIVSNGDLLRYFSGVSAKTQNEKKPSHVDKEIEYVATDLSSRFAYVAKARANIWIITATVLFIIGFLAGMAYVVNPKIFNTTKESVKFESP